MCTWTLQYILLNQLHYTGSFKLYCEGGLYQCCNQNEVLPKEIKEYTLDYILGSIICLQTWFSSQCIVLCSVFNVREVVLCNIKPWVLRLWNHNKGSMYHLLMHSTFVQTSTPWFAPLLPLLRWRSVLSYWKEFVSGGQIPERVFLTRLALRPEALMSLNQKTFPV